MADTTTREIVHDRKGNGVAWLALFIAVVALFIAWMAYNRTGEDLENRIQQQVNQAADEVQQRTPEVDVDVDPPQDQQDNTDTTNTSPTTETQPAN